MKSSRRIFPLFLAGLIICVFAPMTALAQSAVAPVANPCPRLAAGSVVHNPPSLFSQKGVLIVNFSYQTRTDAHGRSFPVLLYDARRQKKIQRSMFVRATIWIVNVTNVTFQLQVE